MTPEWFNVKVAVESVLISGNLSDLVDICCKSRKFGDHWESVLIPGNVSGLVGICCSSRKFGDYWESVLIPGNLSGLVGICCSSRKFGDQSLVSLVRSYQWLQSWLLQWLPCQASGIKGSLLELTGPSVSKLCLSEIASLICNFYFTLVPKVITADPSPRHTCILLGL